MADYSPDTFVNDSGPPFAGATELNKLGVGVQDAAQHHKSGLYANRPPASAANKNWLYYATDVGRLYGNFDGATWTLVAESWIEVDLLNLANYTITPPGLHNEIELELNGRFSGGSGQGFVMVQPQGTGTTLNARSARFYLGLNAADGVVTPTTEDSTPPRDQGMCAALVEGWPEDVIARGTFDFNRGVGISLQTDKKRDTTDTWLVANHFYSMLYNTGQVPTGVKLVFNLNSAAAVYTGKLRYRWRP